MILRRLGTSVPRSTVFKPASPASSPSIFGEMDVVSGEGMPFGAMRCAPLGDRSCGSSVSFLPDSTALPTITPSIGFMVRILFRELVTVLAMCLPRVDGSGRDAPSHILAWRDWLQMIGVAAATIAAKVVKIQSVRHVSDQSFVGDAMTTGLFLPLSIPQTDPTVAARTNASPLPAFIGCAPLLAQELKKLCEARLWTRFHSSNIAQFRPQRPLFG